MRALYSGLTTITTFELITNMRRQCPSCGTSFRGPAARKLHVDQSYKPKGVPWYKPVAAKLTCEACGAALATRIRPVAWAGVAVHFLAIVGSNHGIKLAVQNGILSPSTGSILLDLLAPLLVIGIVAILHYGSEYTVAPTAAAERREA